MLSIVSGRQCDAESATTRNQTFRSKINTVWCQPGVGTVMYFLAESPTVTVQTTANTLLQIERSKYLSNRDFGTPDSL